MPPALRPWPVQVQRRAGYAIPVGESTPGQSIMGTLLGLP